MRSGRRIAFDFGVVRIGVALSDTTGTLASPLTTLSAADTDLMHQIQQLLGEYEPIYIVIGNPIHLSGQASEKSEAAREFASAIRALVETPIFLVDERLSTSHALKAMQAVGHTAKSARNKIDEMAAVQILENALAQERNLGQVMGDSL